VLTREWAYYFLSAWAVVLSAWAVVVVLTLAAVPVASTDPTWPIWAMVVVVAWAYAGAAAWVLPGCFLALVLAVVKTVVRVLAFPGAVARAAVYATTEVLTRIAKAVR
jgi:hypothetical protein